MLASLEGGVSATPTQAPSADGLHPVPSPSRSFAPTTPTSAPTPTPVPTVQDDGDDDDDDTSGASGWSDFLMIPYALIYFFQGLFTCGFIPMNDQYDELYQCFISKYAVCWGLGSSSFIGNVFRRITGVAEVFSAFFMFFVFAKDSDAYQTIAGLELIGVITCVYISCAGALTHHLCGDVGIRHNSVMAIWGLLLLLLRCSAVHYNSEDVLWVYVWLVLLFVFSLLMAYGYVSIGSVQLANDEKEAALISSAEGVEVGGSGGPPAPSAGSKLYNSIGKLSNRFFHE